MSPHPFRSRRQPGTAMRSRGTYLYPSSGHRSRSAHREPCSTGATGRRAEEHADSKGRRPAANLRPARCWSRPAAAR